MRLFVAAALPESWKDALDRAARALADQGVRGNFTRRENYHLTLVFLGETDRLDDVIDAMDTVDAPPFPLRTCGVGRFRRSSGDILWVGVQAAPGLTEAQWQLSHALAGAGFPLEERAYRPHLTLARRAILPRSMDEGRLSGLLTPLELTLDRLTLMCSERRSGLLRYTPIYEKRLF